MMLISDYMLHKVRILYKKNQINEKERIFIYGSNIIL